MPSAPVPAIALWVLALVLSACATSPLSGLISTAPLCQRIDATTLRLAGPIDADMAACIDQEVDDTLQRLIITSPGGSARTAMAIGDRLAPLDIHLIVDEICASSCANYLVPIAGRLAVESGGMIALHGSLDPGLVDAATRIGADSVTDASTLVALQSAYSARHSIPTGWFLYRETYSADGTRIKGLEGQFAVFDTRPHTLSILIAEESFVSGCFPDLEVDPFIATRSQQAKTDPRLARRLARQGYFRSGTAVCSFGP